MNAIPPPEPAAGIVAGRHLLRRLPPQVENHPAVAGGLRSGRRDLFLPAAALPVPGGAADQIRPGNRAIGAGGRQPEGDHARFTRAGHHQFGNPDSDQPGSRRSRRSTDIGASNILGQATGGGQSRQCRAPGPAASAGGSGRQGQQRDRGHLQASQPGSRPARASGSHH